MSARTVLNEAEKHGVKVTLNAAANSNPVFQSGRRLDGIGSARARGTGLGKKPVRAAIRPSAGR